MKLKDLLEGIPYQLVKGDLELEVSSIAYDSRKVGEGSLFVCLKGFEADGHRYIPQALQAGAAALLVEDVPAELPGDMRLLQDLLKSGRLWKKQ